MSFNNDGNPPDSSELLVIAARKVASEIYSMLPCKVVKFDDVAGCVDVQVLSKLVNAKGEAESFPVIPCCPVVFPSVAGFCLTMPINVGDTGHVLFSTLSMSSWQAGGEDNSDPGSRSRGALSQGIFIPGLRHQKNVLPSLSSDSLFMGRVDGSAGLTVSEASNVNLKGAAVSINGGGLKVAQAEAIFAELQAIQVALAGAPAAAAPYIPTALSAADLAVSSLTSD